MADKLDTTTFDNDSLLANLLDKSPQFKSVDEINGDGYARKPDPSFTIDEWVQMTRFASNVQEWQIEQVVSLANWVAKITGR
jgi:hypothetical protein